MVFEFDDIVVVEFFMDFYLAHELQLTKRYLLFGLGFGEGRLLDDFDCEEFLGLLRYEFVASGEPPFAEEVAFEIGGDFVVIEVVVVDKLKIFVGWG